MNDELSVTISVSRKVNLGNYESADVFQSISGITTSTTEEQIDELLNGNGALAFSKLTKDLQTKIKTAKA